MNRKRVLSAILTIFMLLSFVVPTAFAQESSVYVTIGNVVNDGNVNIKDATAVQKHIAGIITLSGVELLAADTNGDGAVNIKDATVIQKHIAGFSVNQEMGSVIELPSETTPDETEPASEVVPTCTGCDIPVVTLPDTTEPATIQTDPSEIPSTPDTAQRDIYFNVECSMRVTDYEGRDTGGTILHLIKNPEELKAMLSGIKVTMYGDGTYTTPDASVEYTEEFFEKYALLVSLNCVGGSNCWQEIDRLFVEGKVLTTQRTLYHPCLMLCDMNWQYMLVKVKAEDVRGVETLADDSYIDECTQVDPTEPLIKPTEPTAPVTQPSVEPTSASVTEPVTTQKPADATTPAINGNIPFTVKEEGRITDYRGSDQERVLYADSVEAAREAYAQIVLDPYYQGSSFLNPTLDEKYDEEFFESKALVLSLNCVGGSNCYQNIDKLTVCDGVLTLHRTLYKPIIVTCDMNYQYVLIEVEKSDVGIITSTQNHNTYCTIED